MQCCFLNETQTCISILFSPFFCQTRLIRFRPATDWPARKVFVGVKYRRQPLLSLCTVQYYMYGRTAPPDLPLGFLIWIPNSKGSVPSHNNDGRADLCPIQQSFHSLNKSMGHYSQAIFIGSSVTHVGWFNRSGLSEETRRNQEEKIDWEIISRNDSVDYLCS